MRAYRTVIASLLVGLCRWLASKCGLTVCSPTALVHKYEVGKRDGMDLLCKRFRRTGSLSPHHPVQGFHETGRAEFTDEAKAKIAAELRSKADEVEAGRQP